MTWLGELIDDLPSSITEGMPGHNTHSVLYKSIFQALRLTVAPSGDVGGTEDVANITAALTDAITTSGTVTLMPGLWYLDDLVTVPDCVNLWGSGAGAPGAGTLITCTSSGAGISFGEHLTFSRHGLSGNFTIDGDDLADRPLLIGGTVCSTFMAIDSYRSAGEGIVLLGSQNCTFTNVHSTLAATIGYLFDASAQSNRFFNCEIDSPGEWFVKFADDEAFDPDLLGVPYHNHFYGGIMERIAASGGIWQAAGDRNGIHDVIVTIPTPGATDPFVKVDSGLFTVDGGTLQSNTATSGTAFEVASGASLIVGGEPDVFNQLVVFDNDGFVQLNSAIRAAGYTTYAQGAAGLNGPTPVGDANLGCIPIATSQSQALTGTQAAITSSRWRLDPANWPTPPPGRTLQFRFRALAISMTAGDVFSVQGLNETDAVGIPVAGPFTKAAAADGSAEAASAWQTFPATPKLGYVNVRNDTAARGNVVAAYIDVRII